MTRWVDDLIPDPQPAAPAVVAAAQNALRVPLPQDFLAVAATRQGARPEPGDIALPNGTVTTIAHLLHFEDSPPHTNIVGRGFPLRGILPKGVIPFAEDVGGDLLCFNYREDYDHPPIAFWSVDTGLLPVAASFSDLLAKLHDSSASP